VLVVHGEDGQYHAFPNRCTHSGHRRIDPVPGEDKIRCCSVGKSTFEYSGQTVSGSAKEPLEPLTLEADGSKLIISVV
jgi:nitrite reductase/ring-hydroxylating ferredoxin subunit